MGVPKPVIGVLLGLIVTACVVFYATQTNTPEEPKNTAQTTAMWEKPLTQEYPQVYDNAPTTAKGCSCKSSCMTGVAFSCYDQPFCLVDSKECSHGEADFSYTYWSYYDYCTWSEDQSYETKSAKDKAGMINSLVKEDTAVGSYPNALGIFTESVRYSFEPPSDIFTMPDRKKYIHSVGVVAPFKFVRTGGSYTGIFEGADYGLIRFSSAVQPSSSGGFTPGAGIKFFRDGIPSANFVAMPTLDAQSCSEPNFFAKTFTNHPGGGSGFQLELLAKKFWQGSSCPHMVGLSDVATFDQNGNKAANPVFPFELHLVPASGIDVQIPCDDYEKTGIANLRKLSAGTKLFEVQAAAHPGAAFETIGHFELTDSPASSKFGDEKLFFRHQWMENDFAKQPGWLKQFDVTKVCGMPCVGTSPPSISSGCSSPFNNAFASCPFKDLY